MKALRFVALLLLAGALAACAMGPTLAQRSAYVTAHPYLTPVFAKAILHAQIMVGMSKDDVRAAWGDPCYWCAGAAHSSWGDVWDYNELGDAGEASATLVFFGPDGTVTGWSQP